MVRRLKTRAQFQAVLAGATVSRTAHFALHRLELNPPAAAAVTSTRAELPLSLFPSCDAACCGWVGAMTPKRWARRAVTRNSIRRQILAVSASFEDRLSGAAHVVRLRAAFDRAQFVSATSDALRRAVRTELLQLFGRLSVAASAALRPPAPPR